MLSDRPPEPWREQAHKAISRSVSRGLTEVGNTRKEAAYFFFETRYNLPEDQIPADAEGFVVALRSVFRLEAARILTKIIQELDDVRPRSEGERRLIESYASVLRAGKYSVETGIE